MTEDFDIKVRRRRKAGAPITVVEVVYAPTPDADRRIAAAIDMLLRASGHSRDEEGMEEKVDDGR